MKNIKYYFLSFLLILLIFNIDILIESTKYASILFFNKIFVCIFSFIILSDILIYYDYHIFLEKVFGKLITILFNTPKCTTNMIILSIFLASPSNTLILKSMLDNKQIDERLANQLLTFTFTNSIPFVIGSIGYSLYNSFLIGIIFWLFMILNNTLIGIYLGKKNNYINNISIEIKKEESLFLVIKNSINKAFNTSFIILGNLIISICIINIIKIYIHFNPIVLSILSGIIEITNGIIITSSINIPIIFKLSITLFLITFNGLSIIFQSISILSNYKINIKRILITKLVFSLITTFIFCCILLLYFLQHTIFGEFSTVNTYFNHMRNCYKIICFCLQLAKFSGTFRLTTPKYLGQNKLIKGDKRSES